MLPAVFVSALYSPELSWFGEMLSWLDFNSAPLNFALEISPASKIPVKCCGFNFWKERKITYLIRGLIKCNKLRTPPSFLPARIFVIRTGLFSKTDKAVEILKICPPPSRYDPSISISVGISEEAIRVLKWFKKGLLSYLIFNKKSFVELNIQIPFK